MSRLAGRMPKGMAAQSFLAAQAPTAAVARRSGTTACLALRTAVPARFSSTGGNNQQQQQQPRSSGPSFKGQLTHSIMKRLARERADLERMARTRPESKLARNFSLTFGTMAMYFCTLCPIH